MPQNVHDFIKDLCAENDAFFDSLPDEKTTYWPEVMDDKIAVEALLPRWYNELRGVEVIGKFIERVPDLSLKVLVGRQVGDEAKHARLCRRRIEQLGGSVLDYHPSPEQVRFGDILDGFAYPEEFFAAQQLTIETQSIKRNEKALERFDPETASMFRRNINPDERFHARLGHVGLRVFARTSAAQMRAQNAARLIRPAHVAMVQAHYRRIQPALADS